MKWRIFFLAVLLSGAVSQAETENPYAIIVSRNAFGLIPIPTNPPVDVVPETPPPKITPNGIMDIFGKLQALFKVAVPAKGSVPAHDESYVLSEGEQQDEIEVTKINKKEGVVTFSNHGKVQELPLIVGVASGGAAPAGGGALGGIAGAAPGAGLPANNFANRFGRNPNLAKGNPGNPNATGAPGTGGEPSLGGAEAGGNNPRPEEQLSPEAQVLMIEKNRLDTQQQVDQGFMPPLPPTAITPADATAHEGVPLVVDPTPAPK